MALVLDGTAGITNPGSETIVGTLGVSTANPGGLIQESVIAPSLQNSWVDNGGGYLASGYYKDSLGVVHLQGMIKSGTTADGTTLFTLNSGYRPASNIIVPICTSAYVEPCTIQIATTGVVSILSRAVAGWMSMDGVTFRV